MLFGELAGLGGIFIVVVEVVVGLMVIVILNVIFENDFALTIVFIVIRFAGPFPLQDSVPLEFAVRAVEA